MKIFWSWQSDTPDNIGRSFVRKALEAAIKEIKAEISVEEADRDDIHLDHDRLGVPGSPDLFATILRKIRESSVVISDVTLVALTENGKHLINSNVAIEYGHAHDRLGDSGILMVMNEHYGSPDSLPFDLRHKYVPITYKLHPEASPEEIGSVGKELVKQLKEAIKDCIKGEKVRPVQDQPTHIEIKARSPKSQYFGSGEVLAYREIKGVRHDYRFAAVPLLYLRVIPTKRKKELRNAEIQNLIYGIKLLPLNFGSSDGGSQEMNQYGGMTFSFDGENKLLTSTQLFSNREIWGIDATMLVNGKSIPSLSYEQVLNNGLRHYLEFAQNYLHLEYPVIIEAGASSVRGFSMAMGPRYREQYWGKVMAPDIKSRQKLPEYTEEAVNRVLLKIFEDFFDAVAAERPPNFNGFPP